MRNLSFTILLTGSADKNPYITPQALFNITAYDATISSFSRAVF